MTTKNVIITTSVVASVIGLGFLCHHLFSSKKEQVESKPEEKKEPLKTKNKPSTVIAKKEAKPVITDEFPLRLGSKGKRVEQLQAWLLRNYGYTGKLSKVFDEKTVKLTQKYLKTAVITKEKYDQLGIGRPAYKQLTKQ